MAMLKPTPYPTGPSPAADGLNLRQRMSIAMPPSLVSRPLPARVDAAAGAVAQHQAETWKHRLQAATEALYAEWLPRSGQTEDRCWDSCRAAARVILEASDAELLA